MPSTRFVRLDDSDNVAVVIDGGHVGDLLQLPSGPLTLLADVPAGHKAALADVPAGGDLVKYGHVFARATKAIKAGDWVHTHNAATALTGKDRMDWTPSDLCPGSPDPDRTFMGYVRSGGRPGIRNDLWVIPTVGCVNGMLQSVIRTYRAPGWITDVKVLAHPFGCSQLGDDLQFTADALVGLARHPNAAGVLIVGLGCENLEMDTVREALKDRANVRFTQLQEPGDEFEIVPALLDELAGAAPRERTPFDFSQLVVGVKCGGSDAFSSLTANPLVGRFSDFLVAQGGTILASEIPEMFGAEDILASRIADRKVFDEFQRMIDWFKDYFTGYGQPISENPSPGNKAGGITTLEEKSLGAVKKAGSAPITDVLWYGEQAERPGVNVVFAPGNDLVSCTAMAASGAHIILFTTGRGTPYGTAVPTVKIATNSDLAAKKPRWIDFDAGSIVDDGDWESALAALTDLVSAVASGKPARNEENGIAEIAIFKHGVTM